jgi:hypothetical protein
MRQLPGRELQLWANRLFLGKFRKVHTGRLFPALFLGAERCWENLPRNALLPGDRSL